MSRLFEALSALKAETRSAKIAVSAAESAPARISQALQRKMKSPRARTANAPAEVAPVTGRSGRHDEPEAWTESVGESAAIFAEEPAAPPLEIFASPESRVVAWTEPNSLGAEKFRSLAARLDHLRGRQPLRSLQVTSGAIHEGKTLISANIAITLAKYANARTLLVEGDLHRPALANALGFSRLRGIGEWWSNPGATLGAFVRRIDGMPLWFLSAGTAGAQAADVLRSARFEQAFTHLAGQFDWVIVDSTPMAPIVDVNLWSRLVDGALLVVREGLTAVKTLQSGLRSLDNPRWIGVVVNDAAEFDHADYQGQYYGGAPGAKNSAENS